MLCVCVSANGRTLISLSEWLPTVPDQRYRCDQTAEIKCELDYWEIRVWRLMKKNPKPNQIGLYWRSPEVASQSNSKKQHCQHRTAPGGAGAKNYHSPLVSYSSPGDYNLEYNRIYTEQRTTTQCVKRITYHKCGHKVQLQTNEG